MNQPFKIDRFDRRVIQGESVGPCNCSRFVWQIVNINANMETTSEQESCIDCHTPTGRTRIPGQP